MLANYFVSKLAHMKRGLRSTEEAFLLPTQQTWIRQVFFSLLLSLWTVLRSDPSRAKQWILRMQLVVTSIAKYYKKAHMKKESVIAGTEPRTSQ